MAGDRPLGVVGVHVDDRSVEALGEVARVARRAPVVRIGREADLVVRDQVERAPRRVAGEPLQVERLRDDALPRERGVAVDQDGKGGRRVVHVGRRLVIGLQRARLAFDDRVDVLEVARVGGEADANVAARRLAHALGAVVVLDVAGSALRVRRHRLDRLLALELAQDRFVRAADDVSEDVQAAAVCHAHYDVTGAVARGELDRLVEHRGPSRRGLRSRTTSARGTRGAGTAPSPRPR